MGVPFRHAQESLQDAVNILYKSDPRIRSVGITHHKGNYGYRVVRNSAVARPLSSDHFELPEINDVPIVFADTRSEVKTMVLVVHSGDASSGNTSIIPEVNQHRPLAWGLQIQNFDFDLRQQIFQHNLMTVGTLGCFVSLPNNHIAILSNNHVLAGENEGICNNDRILQPGSAVCRGNDPIAILNNFVPLRYSMPGTLPHSGNVVYNEVDAAVAQLRDNVAWTPNFLPLHGLHKTCQMGQAGPHLINTRVYKRGRTTGLTTGRVVEVGTVVGPINYNGGICWFQDSIVVENEHGSTFANHGDSGSLVLSATNEVIGLLYASNGLQTYICPLAPALNHLVCTINLTI